MGITYSTYDAKARFSAVLRQVREGKTVTVSCQGKPVAEIRAIRDAPATIESRLNDLESPRSHSLPLPSRSGQ